MSEAVIESELPLPRIHQGKVRDVYAVGSDRLLMVASDRISAFDVVLPQPIPRKGEVLTQATAWWLGRLEGEGVHHHLLAADPDHIVELEPALEECRRDWTGRAMLVRRTQPVMVECVVRGYLSGSAWKEYRRSGTLAGEPLPPELRESQRLPEPVFSPATKALEGHDENITFDQMVDVVGREQAEQLRTLSFHIYEHGRAACAERGILLADTKFEFGLTGGGELLLIDEVLTPDSSRFWPLELYEPGRPQPSLDKQPVRDWLDGLDDWDKAPPAPDLPPEVVSATSARYQDVFRRLTGDTLDGWTAPRFGPGPQ